MFETKVNELETNSKKYVGGSIMQVVKDITSCWLVSLSTRLISQKTCIFSNTPVRTWHITLEICVKI